MADFDHIEEVRAIEFERGRHTGYQSALDQAAEQIKALPASVPHGSGPVLPAYRDRVLAVLAEMRGDG